MLLKSRIKQVKHFFKNENVLTNIEERYCYATDAYNTNKESKIPDIVAFAETIEDVQKIVKYANQNMIPIVSRGAGTNMVGACQCTKGGIVLNFSKMNKILEISSTNLTITVQPGTILSNIKNEADKAGLFFPPDPSNFRVSTIGGAIAQSSGGALSFKYGTIKDYVLSLKVVTADGELITLGANTLKNSYGYHLGQLIVGSEGTLAIIVEATLKLIPKPETKILIASYFNEHSQALKAVNEVLTTNIFPAAIDFMDQNSINTVEDFSQLGLNRNAKSLILTELDGEKTSIKKQAELVQTIFNRYDSIDTKIAMGNDAEKIWQARQASFAAASRLAPDIISDDIIVPRENLTSMISGCNDICNKYKLKICLVGHIGDGNIHPQIALDLNNENEFRNYQNAKAEIYSLANKLGGIVSAEHGIGVEKKEYFESTIDKNCLEFMRNIKKMFDPNNILNPGKIFRV